jgi:hypothetical protein
MRKRAWLALSLLLGGSGLARAEDPTLGWVDTYDGGPGLADDGTALVVAPDGDVVVGGESFDADGAGDLSIRKLSRQDGHQRWQARWEEPGGNSMALTDLEIDVYGDVLVGGYVRGCVG